MLTQEEIDSLLTQSHSIDDQAQKVSNAPPSLAQFSPDVWGRIKHISVPISVVLAERKIRIKEAVNFRVGSILEFDTNAESELHLLAGTRKIGRGNAVKAGENYGIRLTSIFL